MPYASFRCVIEAPLAQVWESLQYQVQNSPRSRSGAEAIGLRIDPFHPDFQYIQLQGMRLREALSFDRERLEITLALSENQELRGHRRFVVRRQDSAILLETSLDWELGGRTPRTTEQRLLPLAELLVRDLALMVKDDAERMAPSRAC